MIAIVDYGMGNLRSVQKGLEKVGCAASITNDGKKIEDAKAVVLPGVGAFKAAMENLNKAGLVEPILSSVRKGKPFLGICLGLHLLFTKSVEFGECAGLDLLPGTVVPFEQGMSGNGAELKIPHMGWNRARPAIDSPFFDRDNSEGGKYFYFVHSYYVAPDDPGVTLAETDYGVKFTSAVWKDNILAFQFHPEKSQDYGLELLKKFGEVL